NHQVLEAASLIFVHTGVNQSSRVPKKLLGALLLFKKLNDRSISSGEILELLFAARIWNRAPVENESSAISSFIFRRTAPMKGKTVDTNHKSGARRYRCSSRFRFEL